MHSVDLSMGTIDYEDTGGPGPVLVLLHGVAMDGSVWRPVVDDLRSHHRCIVPTLPLGSHRHPMHPEADLTLRGYGAIVAELLEALDLDDVVLVQNDHGAALAAAVDHPERVGRLVVSSCEAFDNYPPGLPGKNLRLASFVPGVLGLAMQTMRLGVVRRSPIGMGWMAKHPLPDDLVDGWLAPVQTDPDVRADLARYARGARKRQLVELCDRLGEFERPVLVVWTPEDRVQRPEHGRRLAETFPDARLVEIEDSYTLIMRDQPAAFATAIRDFVAETDGSRSSQPAGARG